MSVLRHPDAKIERLRSVPLFADADKNALKHLASAADEITVPEGQAVIVEGHRHQDGFLILSGTAAVFIGGEKIAEVGEGAMVGELSLFGFGPASATVRATSELSVLSIPANRFDQLLDDNPALTKSIARQLAGRLHAADELIMRS
jgi:CRP-like cAMP-binding protein